MTDPRFTDPQRDPLVRSNDAMGGTWGWIAGIAVLALIAFVLIAGWNSNPNTANNGAPPVTTGSSVNPANPPSTTGAGGTSPSPMAPAPAPSQAPAGNTQQ